MDSKENNSERPPDSDFQQQNLKAWQPLLTPGWVIWTFFVISIIFVPIGAIILDASGSVHMQEFQYQSNCQFDSEGGGEFPRSCVTTVTLNITEDMKKPVYFYYKLTNFYQNHRRYVKSRDDKQLRGDLSATMSSCEPLIEYNGFNNGSKSLYPCGLIANSYFNDTFTNFQYKNADGNALPLNQSSGYEDGTYTDNGIAWASDKKDKFKKIDASKLPESWTRVGPGNFQLPDVDQEDFIVWMRTAGLPNFKKLRYIIHRDLDKGSQLTVNVKNAFPVAAFKGTKSIVISTTSWLGGKNDFLGYAYIMVGSLCFLLASLFLIKHCFHERPLGDMHYFNWHNNRDKNAAN